MQKEGKTTHLLKLLFGSLDGLELKLLLVRLDPFVLEVGLVFGVLALLLRLRLEVVELVAQLHPLVLEGADLRKMNGKMHKSE
jgi:hypothetical protein